VFWFFWFLGVGREFPILLSKQLPASPTLSPTCLYTYTYLPLPICAGGKKHRRSTAANISVFFKTKNLFALNFCYSLRIVFMQLHNSNINLRFLTAFQPAMPGSMEWLGALNDASSNTRMAYGKNHHAYQQKLKNYFCYFY
jgi:hypothetical protein